MVLFDRDPFQIFHRALTSAPTRSAAGPLGRPRAPRGTEAPSAGAVDVTSDETGTQLTMLVPGFGAEHIDVSVERGALRIRGEHGARRFERSFRLPHAVEMEDANAHVDLGVLTLTLPRSGAERRRQIPVRPAGPAGPKGEATEEVGEEQAGGAGGEA